MQMDGGRLFTVDAHNICSSLDEICYPLFRFHNHLKINEFYVSAISSLDNFTAVEKRGLPDEHQEEDQ